ncbi:hypothetical protein VTL71DRAFT_14966 [Oculimacula yallundae]|uniref:Peptidase M20 dimerisation domain-containing protein n=1 Tax=Oculimacula yallundae TaxID=86028 RepID=A0ABR4CHI2_9HELO
MGGGPASLPTLTHLSLTKPSKMSTKEILGKHRPDLSSYETLYKTLHQNPGLSLQEHLAAETAAKHLKSLPGFDVRTNIGGTGLVGILKNGSGPTILLRADTDALPVKELTGLPYASEKRETDVEDGIEKPVMHACGHDMHITCMLAAASTLSSARDSWKGTLIILFQPNEERGAGAKAMIADGLYDPSKHNCPVPDIVLGQHVMPFPSGEVGTRIGSFASAADSFRVTVYGRGGHASQPHRTIDPVVLAAHIIVRLQTVVSREVDPREAAVVTVGSIQSGMTENIISDEAVIKINVRTVTPETRTRVLAAIKRIVKAECEASGSPKPPLWESTSSFPFTINDSRITQTVQASFSDYFGDKHNASCNPLGGSEDFAILATEAPNPKGENGKGVPYCYWVFGGTDPELWKKKEEEGKLEDVPINHRRVQMYHPGTRDRRTSRYPPVPRHNARVGPYFFTSQRAVARNASSVPVAGALPRVRRAQVRPAVLVPASGPHGAGQIAAFSLALVDPLLLRSSSSCACSCSCPCQYSTFCKAAAPLINANASARVPAIAAIVNNNLVNGQAPTADTTTVMAYSVTGRANRLAAMPRLRQIQIRPAFYANAISLPRPSYREACMGYVVGVPRAAPCVNCVAGRGPFPLCIVVPSEGTNACQNCFYFSHGRDCQ